MTFAEVYTEIITRSGEGYDNYLDRAKEMFFKAISTILNSGEYDPTEVRLMSSRFTKNIGSTNFTDGRYDINRIWSDQAVPDVTLSPFYTHELFDARVELTPVAPENMRFSQVSIERLNSAHLISQLSIAAGIPELIWGFDYPDIRVNTITNTSFRCLATLSTHSIPRADIDEDSTPADRYMSYHFLIRAIEMAVNLLKTETE